MINITGKLGVFFVLILLFYPSIAFTDNASSPEAPPTLREKKTKEGYILDLKELIKKSKAKIEQVDEKLKEQAKERRNEQREEKAREYYEKAMRLYEEGKFTEAQALWDKAIKITEHPEMKNYIDKSARKSKKLENNFRAEERRNLKRLEVERGFSASAVEKAYQEAVSLFKQKNYLAAKDEFEHVEDMFPDHKATRSYLMVIEQEIQKQQQQIIAEKLKDDEVARRKDREAWRTDIERKEKDRQEKLKMQAEGIYKEATILYKTRQFEEAKDKFKEVAWILPDYKATGQYLAAIDGDIDREKKRRVQVAEEEKQRALKQEQAAKLSPQEQEKRQKAIEAKVQQDRQKEEAEFVYTAAVSLYNEKLYSQAKDKFLEVQKICPDYKATKNYLVKLKKEKSAKKEEVKQSPATRPAPAPVVAAEKPVKEDLASRFKKEESEMI